MQKMPAQAGIFSSLPNVSRGEMLREQRDLSVGSGGQHMHPTAAFPLNPEMLLKRRPPERRHDDRPLPRHPPHPIPGEKSVQQSRRERPGNVILALGPIETLTRCARFIEFDSIDVEPEQPYPFDTGRRQAILPLAAFEQEPMLEHASRDRDA